MAEGSEIEYDPEFGIAILNDTEVSTNDVIDAVRRQAPEISILQRWQMSNHTATRGGRKKTIFERDKYLSPDNIFDKFRVAADAVQTDDIVANVVETTENLAFKRVAIECEDELESYVWREVIDDIDLSERLRECWRELFTISQAYPVVFFGEKDFKVKDRKKYFNGLKVPIGVSLLDPLKVIPVGNFMFGQEDLVYIADVDQIHDFETTLAGSNSSDLIVNQLIDSKYNASREELKKIDEMTGLGLLDRRLFKLRRENAWRITATRPSYERFANVRMESVFELLDLKHILREMDRSAILGATNAIILVKKGDKDNPARPQEIQQLAGQIQTASRVPIIVGDHRIEIEIITPKTDKTLAPERYNGIDSRLTSRLYQILNTGNYAAGTASDDSMKLLKVIASSMEARRDKIRDSFMAHVFKPMWNMNDSLKMEPEMAFYPRRIALDFDPNIAAFMQDLRDRGDISRSTILAELDILQENEAYKRQIEKDKYDEVFSPVNVPFSTPNPVNPANPAGTNVAPSTAPGNGPTEPKAAGRRGGGNSNGGGRNPDSFRPNPA